MIKVEEILPDVYRLAIQIANELKANSLSNQGQLIRCLQPCLEPDFVEAADNIVPGWKRLAASQSGITAMHTMLVLIGCLNLPEYARADQQTQTEIEWAALLHDLDKRETGNDPAHPFRSAAHTARILPGLGFCLLPGIQEEDLTDWSDLVLSAQKLQGERLIHDHSRLKDIIDGIHCCWGKRSSASRILKAILLHQSLPTLKAWPGPVLLNDEELAYSLSLDDMQVLCPLIMADSDSWNIFNPERIKSQAEVRENCEKACGRLGP